jgi:hypothetical protein
MLWFLIGLMAGAGLGWGLCAVVVLESLDERGRK